MHVYKTSDFIGYNKPYNAAVCAEARNVNLHSHEFYEIAYVVSGYGTHYTKDSSFLLKEGDFVFISPEAEHCTASSHDENVPRIRICNCLFTPEYFNVAAGLFLQSNFSCTEQFNNILNDAKPFCIVMHDTQAFSIKNLLFSMKREMDMQENCIDAIIKNLFNAFLIEAGRIYDSQFHLRSSDCRSDVIIQELISYIKTNLDLVLTLNMLANHVHFSPEYLSRYFKKHTGKKLSCFITELRIEKAKDLLCHTSYPISEIGYLCGYSSVSNFRKYFKNTTGLSPLTYRKQHL